MNPAITAWLARHSLTLDLHPRDCGWGWDWVLRDSDGRRIHGSHHSNRHDAETQGLAFAVRILADREAEAARRSA